MGSAAGTAGSAQSRTARVEFDRKLRGLNWLVVRGTLLSLVTFGIYRFWYITELRRFFWSRTILDGSPGEYTGRGKELFLGFLVALAILIPIYVIVFVAALSVPVLAPFSGVMLVVILYPLAQYAQYRGRRYRASRTLWRGIRLGQDGSGVAYAVMAVGWGLLSIATLGLAFPFMRASLERYRIGHTLIGSSRMVSTARGVSILKPWLTFYVVALAPIILAAIAFFIAAGFTIPRDIFLQQPGAPPGKLMFNEAYRGTSVITFGIILLVTYGVCAILALLLIPYYRARETRNFMSAAALGEVRLVSTLKARQLYWPYLIYAGSLIAFVVLIGGLATVATLTLRGGANAGTGRYAVMAVLGVAYLGGAFLMNVLYVRVVQARLWRIVAEAVRIKNAQALDAILASGRRTASGLNEGMADALDVGGALEIGF